MADTMSLRIAAPTEIVVDSATVRYVQAEDSTGVFAIQPGHADFLTVLVPCVLVWRNDGGEERYVALRGGVLAVNRAEGVTVVSREAIAGTELAALRRAVLDSLRHESEGERDERSKASQLHHAFLYQLRRYLRGDDGRARLAGAPGDGDTGAMSS